LTEKLVLPKGQAIPIFVLYYGLWFESEMFPEGTWVKELVAN
jgi:hypothetical protein